MKVYQPNVESMQSYLKDNASNYDGARWYNIPSGMCSIRILPPWDPTGRVALPVYSHRIEYQGKGMKFKKYSWTCVDRTFGKPCKICESLNQLKSVGVDVSEYEPSSRTFYVNAIVMYDPEYDRDSKMGKSPDQCGGTAPGTHVVMRLPKTLYDWLVAQITNPMVGDITSITNGIDVYITKEGSGISTSYSATLSPNGRTAIPQEYLDKIESLYNLDDIFSTGFEDDVVEELSNHLKRSSNMLGSGISNMQEQMSGIPQQIQIPNYQNPVSQPVVNQSQQVQMPVMPQFGVTNIPPQFGQVQVSSNHDTLPPWDTSSNPQPAQQHSTPTTNYQVPSGNQMECFGRYNPGDIKCVTCSQEVPCSKANG